MYKGFFSLNGEPGNRSIKHNQFKTFIMKKLLHIEMTKAETIAFIAIISWIAASCFVLLPEVNSLGR
jgi:hypothetical protein